MMIKKATHVVTNLPAVPGSTLGRVVSDSFISAIHLGTPGQTAISVYRPLPILPGSWVRPLQPCPHLGPLTTQIITTCPLMSLTPHSHTILNLCNRRLRFQISKNLQNITIFCTAGFQTPTRCKEQLQVQLSVLEHHLFNSTFSDSWWWN